MGSTTSARGRQRTCGLTSVAFSIHHATLYFQKRPSGDFKISSATRVSSTVTPRHRLRSAPVSTRSPSAPFSSRSGWWQQRRPPRPGRRTRSRGDSRRLGASARAGGPTPVEDASRWHPRFQPVEAPRCRRPWYRARPMGAAPSSGAGRNEIPQSSPASESWGEERSS